MKTTVKVGYYRQWLRHSFIAFDTSSLIPLLEDKKDVSRVFELAERRSLTLIAPTVTLLEILVRPYRDRKF